MEASQLLTESIEPACGADLDSVDDALRYLRRAALVAEAADSHLMVLEGVEVSRSDMVEFFGLIADQVQAAERVLRQVRTRTDVERPPVQGVACELCGHRFSLDGEPVQNPSCPECDHPIGWEVPSGPNSSVVASRGGA